MGSVESKSAVNSFREPEMKLGSFSLEGSNMKPPPFVVKATRPECLT